MALRARIEEATPDSVTPYGWMLGKPFPSEASAPAFRNSATGFWREHLFDPGKDGEVEVLWVDYNNADPLVGQLEKHHLTQQAVVPLKGNIIQILALSAADGAPDLSSLRAFRLSAGIGLCMRPDVWHATRSKAATCLMLTRASTTVDLIAGLEREAPPTETSLRDIPPVRLMRERQGRA
jgi:ureidoglycolate lyase